MAATGNEVIYEGAFGKRDLSKDDPMTLDSVFWIASMTKAVTSAAGMQLVEQGKLSLDEPIGKVLPDLASPQVLEGSTPRASRSCARPRSRSHCGIS
jgi:methyl acetate hydrolase